MINWEIKKSAGSVATSADDVSVSVQDGGKNKNPKTCVSIKKDLWKECFDSAKKLICGFDPETGRMYFKPDSRGYCVLTGASRNRAYITIYSPHYDFTGTFKLLHDNSNDLYYIDKKFHS